MTTIFSFSEIKEGWRKASKGKRDHPNQQRYLYSLEPRLFDLLDRLNSGNYQPSKLRIKQIYYPKRRQAQVPSLEDKIVQHTIADDHAYYPMVEPLIAEATANTRGRGTDYAVELLTQNLRAFWKENRKQPFILKADVHSFFYSIPHRRVFEIIDERIKDEQIRAVMRSFVNLTQVGLPLGLQQSQLLANIYLSEMDHEITERFGFKGYGRHMDDFYVLSDSKEKLEELLEWVDKYLKSIGLELNPKTKICFKTFDYLGFNFNMSATGKVIIRIAKGKLRAKRRHLKKMVGQLKDGEITPEQFETSYFGWRHHALKARNARTQVINVDKYVGGLLNEIGYELKLIKIFKRKAKVKWRVRLVRKE